MRSVRKISALALLVLGVSAVAPGGSPASAQPRAAKPATTPAVASAKPATTPAVASKPRTVTLLTGDTVHVSTVDGQTAVDVVPGKGRERIPFITHSAGEDVRVIPADAVGLLNRGKLDERLFDISTLVGFGYDDSRATLPLIVQHGSAAPARIAGGRTTRELPGASAVAESRADAVSFWNTITSAASGTERQLRAGVDKIWLDGLRHPTLDVSVPLTGAPQAWQAGWTGTGVKVGVIDTGIDQTHPDLADRVAAAQNFTSDPDTLDRVGHGTHVASTIAGTAAASQGRYKGMAPGATLYSAKVCVEYGCPESAIVAGMTWVAQQGVKVANMSLGGPDSPETDPIEAALADLTHRYGVLFVVAAGNSGEAGESTVSSPGDVEEALTVGAVTKTGELAEFSSRGPRTADAGIKPDITAPGVGIVAARSSTSDRFPYPENPQYTSLSGTSMATPHVAGAAAILAQQHPDWAPERIKSTLMAAAQPSDAIGVYEQGAGFLNVARAIQQPVTASPVSVAFERTTAAQQRTVTYANSGSSDLTLAVSLDAKDADGAPAPAGLFSLSASSVTVPAGGTATVTVNVQAGGDLPDRYFGGEVTATGGGAQVQTPVALDVARHELALKLVGPDGGAPTAEQGWVTVLLDLDRQTILVLGDPAATRYRVRAGRYLVQTYMVSGDPLHPDITSLVRPSLDLTTDQALTMDTRLAKAIAVSVPNPKATAVWQESGWTIRTEQPQIWGSNDPYAVLMNVPFDRVRTAQIGAGKTPGFVSYVHGMWGQVRQGSLHNSPYAYRVYLYQPEEMMTGLTRKLGVGDFATVRSQISADVAGVPVARTAVAHAPGNSPIYRDERNVPPWFTYDVPSTITEYYNQDKQAVWQSTSAQPRYTYYQSAWTSFQPGRTYNVKWANAVAGPVFPEPNFGQQFATRYWGDNIGGPGPLHGDGTGHMGFRFARGGSVQVNLYRNGVKVGDANQTPWVWNVPAETGDYRLTATFRSDPAFTLSTVVDAEWTFKSGHVSDGELVKLPMTAIRYTPELNINNRAPANQLFAIPVSLDRQIGAEPGQATSLTVEASFDDGKTWQQLTVQRSGEKAVVWVHNPAGTGFVSLRAAATDTSGNTVKQTIIRAYRY
ncbi:Subtilase family protein [Micromonospora rhizosphaerae]|uniref:Subtilase family protein n=1 Tax=Micromonospora rhizosphaerae TaxID=568872 RepID=A0A1C6RPZ3_9ACTN|nr:S8 family serine peptidase [Micromonospora rhizosphaerae]SCL19095.1 Subtilase family protein [Micromonospora rhizosphaerae]